ncbi:ABC transporter ATP-binding protein [Pseudooceanicola sp. CBS1P-1]|uniref:ATP-binding cassette domain-containing protein n=1 Tax=Pseudooceanicola albus TaxID=2692189 RepID=A0A6L7GAJ9_9RHOB|nr:MULTISPECIES: ABC transporter ATP-binding protein [Pseudooceanicola]MBT9386757.1 ABC transporter ATP-binding protein [Pseudooceanicola endophyticus]MXN20979.1 ATP-binding cassette domain-containing protein [Pseudooceanicola albus]
MKSLELVNIRKEYGDAVAVDDMNMTIRKGELVSLLGPSGCGKTTTLRMVAGFVAPSAGSVLIDGRDVTHRPPYERNTALVFQSYALFPHMSVAQNVAFGLEMRRMPRAEREAKSLEALRRVRLDHLAERYPRQLSGGQQQRVALARGLVLNPDVFLLDEPLSNLDAKLRAEVRSEIRGLQQALELTTLMVTHDQEEALTMSDGLVLMAGGRVRQSGSAQDLYERPADAFVADFVGRSNVLEGRVEGGSFRMKDGTALPGTAVPTARYYTLRPEKIALTSPDQGVPGTLREVLYLGAQTEYTVLLGTTPVTVIRATPGPDDTLARLRPGDPVGLRWNSADARLLDS